MSDSLQPGPAFSGPDAQGSFGWKMKIMYAGAIVPLSIIGNGLIKAVHIMMPASCVQDPLCYTEAMNGAMQAVAVGLGWAISSVAVHIAGKSQNN